MGYGSVFEYELYFEIIDGEIKKTTTKSKKTNLNLFQKIINFFNFKASMPRLPK